MLRCDVCSSKRGAVSSRMRSTLKYILAFLNQDIGAWAVVIPKLVRVLSFVQREVGMYEVLEYDAQIELKDKQGEKAIYSKRQQVRFLQDNVIAYEDQAWGDGNIFADYRCTPGVAVDRYREGHRYWVLISLRETKKRGDVEEFHIQRIIENGFTRTSEDFQTEIDHKTHKLSLSVIFPPGRIPKQVSLIEQNLAKTTELNGAHRQTLPDGRHQVRWSTENPRLYEAYIIHWVW